MVVSNRGYYGGGMLWSTANNCTLIGNSSYEGGGATLSTLNNCTVVLNSASYGGGVAGGAANNCILYFNSAADDDGGPNYAFDGLPGDPFPLNYCCTTPMPSTNGVGNITNAPAFLDLAGGNFHLQSNSPCINSGKNSSVNSSTDPDGNPRIKGGTVDIGAYEFQNPTSIISYAWLQQYGLPIDGTADLADTDHDGMNNWQEWLAGTDPSDASSTLSLLPPFYSPQTGATISWNSVSSRTYFVQRGSDLKLFATVSPDIPGQPGITSYVDTNAIGNGPFFYRVGVR
jgi:hypothetical protein